MPQQNGIGFFDAVNALFNAYRAGYFHRTSVPAHGTGQMIDDVALIPCRDVLGEDVQLSDQQLICVLSTAMLPISRQFDDEFITRNPDLFHGGLAGPYSPDFFAIKLPYKDIDFECAERDLQRVQFLMQERPIVALQEEPYSRNPGNPLDALEGYSVFLGPFVGPEDINDFFSVFQNLTEFHDKPQLPVKFRHRTSIFGDVISLDRREYAVLFEHESDPAFHILFPDEPAAAMGVQGLAYEM